MKTLTTIILLLITSTAGAEERRVSELTFATHEWPQYGTASDSFTRPIVNQPMSGGSCTVEIADDPKTKGPFTLTVYEQDAPPITQCDFALTGQVGYVELKGPAYLELWVSYADGSKFFSRTLADSGPLMKLAGTSSPRPFRLPFHGRAGDVPTHLAFNIVAPGSGAVMLNDVSLMETVPPTTQPLATATDVSDHDRRIEDRVAALQRAMTAPNVITPAASTPVSRFTHLLGLEWISQHFAVAYCALIASCLALLLLMRSLMKRGKGKALMIGFSVTLMACGVLQIFAAGVAFGAGKPSDAWATLLGTSAILLLIPAMTLRDLSRQYAQFELRKMSAMDVG